MPGFFGDDDDEEDQRSYRAPPPPPARYQPRAGPSSERLDSPLPPSTVDEDDSVAVNGHHNERRRGHSVEMDLSHDLDRDASLPPPDSHGVDDTDDGPPETLVARLTRRWIDEREAPELLPHDEDDIEECLELMRMQSNAIANIRTVETDISEEEHFRFIVVQQDMERVKYIIKNYVRTRQYKIERFSQYLLKTPAELGKLTNAEHAYLQEYHQLLSLHIQRAVLDSLPESLQQVDRSGQYAQPDLDKAVHVFVRRECDTVRLPGGRPLDLEVGTQHFLRYRTIRSLLAAQRVSLL